MSVKELKKPTAKNMEQLKDAITDNSLEKVKILLEENPKVFKYHSKLMLTAAEHAYNEDSWSIVKMFINHGAALDETDNLGMTVAMKAALQGRNDVIQLLIENGADLGKSRSSEFAIATAFDFAICRDMTETASLIKSHLEQKQLDCFVTSSTDKQSSINF